MEAGDAFEMLVTLYQTTWFHMPEDYNLQIHHNENIKCLKIF
jgi:hypothetical protein